MHILSVKKIGFCYFHYQTTKIIFKINIIICHSYLFAVPFFRFDLSWVILISKSKKLVCEWACKTKRNNKYHIKESHRKKVPSNKTPALGKVRIWALGCWYIQSIIYKRFLNWNKTSKKLVTGKILDPQG